MADCLNEANLIGSLANDPDIRHMGDGRQVCNLRVLTTSSWRDRNTGEEKVRQKFTSVVLFSKEAIAQAQRLRQGARVTIRGELQDRKWQDNSGQDKWVTEIVVQGLTHLFIPHTAGGNGASTEYSEAKRQPIENRKSAPQGQNSGQPPAKKYPGRQSHDFDPSGVLDDELPW